MANKFIIPFNGRSHLYSEEEIKLVSELMNNAIPLTQGKYLHEFEEKFARYVGANHCFGLNNATSGLEISAQLCMFSKGDEVIIPAHTYTSSAYPFIKKGANIVWADIDPKYGVTNASLIERCITKKTKAIVVVHLYGYAVQMDEILELAKKYNILIIEDAAQAMGVYYRNQHVGTFGDFGIFSFHSHKNITTLGEGGMILCKSAVHAELIPMLRHNGHCDFSFKKENYWLPAMSNVDVIEANGNILLPNNFCLGEIECALGAKLLDRVDEMNLLKRKRALKIIDSLDEYSELAFNREESKRHNYHLLVANLEKYDRNDFISYISDFKGVQCVVQYYPLYRYDFYKKLGFGEFNGKNSDKFFDTMISFPFQYMMNEREIDYLIESIIETMNFLRK